VCLSNIPPDYPASGPASAPVATPHLAGFRLPPDLRDSQLGHTPRKACRPVSKCAPGIRISRGTFPPPPRVWCAFSHPLQERAAKPVGGGDLVRLHAGQRGENSHVGQAAGLGTLPPAGDPPSTAAVATGENHGIVYPCSHQGLWLCQKARISTASPRARSSR